jgi:Cd2+/Zn2+-exporting ATPase
VDLLMITAAAGAAAIGEWPEGAILLFLFSASNTLEQYILGRTCRAIEALMELSPEEAVVRRDGKERRVPVEELCVGDTVIVRPGERIAVDGIVRAGRTSVDQSAMTGESIPVEKAVGDLVFAGTLNQLGAIEVEVSQPARETKLARIIQLVEEAQSAKAQSERLTDWFGRHYTLAVLVAAVLTLLVPLMFWQESFEVALYRAMTMLVVASPCAVVISIPAAILAAITGAARGGVLFKGGAHLERAAAIRAIAFDKTGTLTIGRPHLVELRTVEGISPGEVLALAASAESLSEHPLAGAVVEAAKAKNLPLQPASDLEAVVGHGIRARVAGKPVFVGKAGLFTERGVAIPSFLEEAAGSLAEGGNTTLFVGTETSVLGLIAVADTLRPGAEAAVAGLRALGVEKMLILSGDSPRVAEAIGKRLGMEAMGALLPEDKLRVLQGLRAQYGVVAMMGDGINDAPALVSADLGISLGDTASDIALETADVVLVGDDLARLPSVVALSRQTLRIIRQNLLVAFGMIGVLLVITFFGSLRLPFAVIGHEGSTLLVTLNSLRLLALPRPRPPV